MRPVIVYVAGVFDILHYGHINYLRQAKLLGDVLIVGLLTDEGVKEYKKDYPILTFEQRLMTLLSIKYVDLVYDQPHTDPTSNLKRLDRTAHFPDILVRADDVSIPVPGQEYIESKGGKVVIVGYTKGISSTIIKDIISARGHKEIAWYDIRCEGTNCKNIIRKDEEYFWSNGGKVCKSCWIRIGEFNDR